MRKLTFAGVALMLSAGSFLLTSGSALAIPVFARKYHTSCTTCHTAWPVLNPFGEAFRRNGFRFPGDDDDAIKQDMIKLGAPAYKKVFPDAVWPDVIPDSVPIAFGFICGANMAPGAGTAASGGSPGTQTGPNGTTVTTPYFSLTGLTTEAHVWTGGTFDNSLSWFGEVTFSTDGTFNVERGYLIFDDLLSDAVGQHVFNLLVGKNFPTMSSFDNHSSYVVDGYIPEVSLPGMLGANGTLTPGINELDTVELNGTLWGRLDYSVGMNSGLNDYCVGSDAAHTAPGCAVGGKAITPGSADAYAHIGAKLGGIRLDGEGGSTSSNPWEDTSVTLDVFGYHSESYYNDEAGNRDLDTALTAGAALRAQLASARLDLGAMEQMHNHPDSTGAPVSMLTGWGELSYVVWPWLIPALRVEYDSIDGSQDPNFGALGGTNAAGATTWGTNPSLIRVLPAIDFVIRPNVVFQLVAEMDDANGQPPGGWGGAGGVIGFPLMYDSTGSKGSGFEFETIGANLRYAF